MINKFDIGILSQGGEAYKIKLNAATASTSFQLPTTSYGTYNFNVEWGDGSSDDISTWDDPNTAHTYVDAGEYVVTIRGTYSVQDFGTSATASSNMVIEVISFGDVAWDNTGVKFRHCTNLTTIPNKLTVRNLTSAESMFIGCSSLASIPAGFFDDCPNITVFKSAFSGCTSLTSIPTGLFDNNINATDFTATFNNCSITSIPSGLFDNCPDVTAFNTVFKNNDLTSIPVGLFDNCLNVDGFRGSFEGNTTLTGAAPELWLRNPNSPTYDTGSPDGYRCFNGCTGLTNYTDIPTYWK